MARRGQDRATVREDPGGRRDRARRRAPPSQFRPAGSFCRRERAGRRRGTARLDGRRRPDRSELPTRASDAASSVCLQPAEARPLRPASSRHRSIVVRSWSALAWSSRGPRGLEQLGRRRVSLGRRPTDDRLSPSFDRALELGVYLLGGDDDDLGVRTTHLPVELLADSPRWSATIFSMCRWKRACDQPPWSWRPGAPRSRRRSPRAGRLQAENLPALAADDRNDRAVFAADQRHERSEVELARYADLVRDRVGKRQRAPGVVEAGQEDRNALRPVPRELVFEVVGDPFEVCFQADALLVREVVRVGALAALALGDE